MAPIRNLRSRLISFRVSEEEYGDLIALSQAHDARSLSDFARLSMRSLVLNNRILLEICRLPNAAAAKRCTTQRPDDTSYQPILSVIVEIEQLACAIENHTRRLALMLARRLPSRREETDTPA